MIQLSTHAAASALGIEEKALDNILAREARTLLPSGRRGRSRILPVPVLERIAIALMLRRDLGTTVVVGLRLADELLATPAGRAGVGTLGVLAFDVHRLRVLLEAAIEDALESVSERPRGRPPRSSSH